MLKKLLIVGTVLSLSLFALVGCNSTQNVNKEEGVSTINLTSESVQGKHIIENDDIKIDLLSSFVPEDIDHQIGISALVTNKSDYSYSLSGEKINLKGYVNSMYGTADDFEDSLSTDSVYDTFSMNNKLYENYCAVNGVDCSAIATWIPEGQDIFNYSVSSIDITNYPIIESGKSAYLQCYLQIDEELIGADTKEFEVQIPIVYTNSDTLSEFEAFQTNLENEALAAETEGRQADYTAITDEFNTAYSNGCNSFIFGAKVIR